MRNYSKKLMVLLLSLAMMLTMSAVTVFAEEGGGSGDTPAVEAFSSDITLVDAEGNEITVTGADIKAAEAVEVTSESPWKYNGTAECFGTFHSLKQVLANAGVDLDDSVHGLKAVATDGFVTGYTVEELDKLYIFDMSEVSRNGSYGSAGTYGFGVEDPEGNTKGNKWASDVASVELATDHVWFTKKGKCMHYCSICGEDEPSLVINPGTDAELKVYECDIKKAASEEATEAEPWKGGKNTYTGTFYSLKSILEESGIDVNDCHGITSKADDGFTNGFGKDDIDDIFIYDQGEVLKNGSPAGKAGTFGTAINGGAGNKWAKGIVSIAVAEDHVWFVKDGECKHYCAICGEDEPGEEIAAVAATCTKPGKAAGFKYECGAETGGEEVAATGEHTWDSGKVTKAATTTATGVKTYTCTTCGETKTESIDKLAAAPTKTPAKTTVKKAQPMKVTAKKVTLKAKNLKKKAQTLAVKKTLTIKNAKGTKTYKITKVNKSKKYFKINAKTGKLTIKKGLKKGTYKVTVNVKAAGNASYKAGSKTKTITIKVK